MRAVAQIGMLLAAAAAAEGQTGSLTREGRYWVEIITGSLPLDAADRLRVTTRGAVTVRGQAGPGSGYTLRKRVRAGNEAEARRLLALYAVRGYAKGGWGYLTVTAPDRIVAGPELTIRAPRALALALLETRGGPVDVSGLDGDVQAETGGGRIEAGEIGGKLTARTGGGDVTLGNLRGAIHCVSGGGTIRLRRAGGECRFETAGGEIHIDEAAGAVHAWSGGGNIHILKAAASVVARTSGGLILVQEAGGIVEAETDGGPIKVGSARGALCESAAGAIVLRGVSGKVRASTAHGSIQAELPAGGPLEDSWLTTSAGDVTVIIPSNLAVTVRAQNESPWRMERIISDFPEIRLLTPNARRAMATAEGALNGGGPVLRISATGGTIYLRRQK